MRKYGIEHFHIYLIERTDNPEEREKYWIEKKGTFKNGYNATVGGDGKRYLDYDVLIAAYKELKNLTKVAEKYHCDRNYLSKILKENNVKILSGQEISKKNNSKPVNQYNLQGQYIQTFPSVREAGRVLNKPGGASAHIGEVCKGKRKTAYGYKWKFVE